MAPNWLQKFNKGYDISLRGLQFALSFKAYDYHERILGLDINRELFRQVKQMGLEVFAFDKRSIFVLGRSVCCTVVFRYGIVNSILGKFSVEFAWIAVQTEPSEVVYPVGQSKVCWISAMKHDL